MNKTIGLVGEDPNDTLSIKNLLLQKYSKNFSYIQLIKCKKGFQLDNERTKISLQIECERKKPDVIIFIRDADGIITQESKLKKGTTWFETISKSISCKKILLLNIYELEALIFADIDIFNANYKVSIKGDRDVTYISEPKEELIRKTYKLNKVYSESHCPELFKELRIDIVSKKCSYFKVFLDEFSELVGEKKKSA